MVTDKAGNNASQTLGLYLVKYGCIDGNGFKSPVPNTQYKVGRDLPEKFNACDVNGNPVPGVQAYSYYKLSTTTGFTPSKSGSNSVSDNSFR